jgi:transcriptional regulator with XRE-family HTH domain
MLAYATFVPINHDWTVKFPQHLALLRKERGLTQPQLAEKIGLHVAQIRRYEAGTSQPTLDVIRSLAVALGVSYFLPRTNAAPTMTSSSSSRPSRSSTRSPRRSSSRCSIP